MDQAWRHLILSLGLGLRIERRQLASVNARLEGCVVSGTVRCVPKSKQSLTASGAGSEVVWTERRKWLPWFLTILH